MDVNLVRLPWGGDFGEHVNDVDVVFVGVSGSGMVAVGGARSGGRDPGVRPEGSSALYPEHLLRGVRHLTMHRRRGPLKIGR